MVNCLPWAPTTLSDSVTKLVGHTGNPSARTAESGMCDVIKIRLKRKDERRSGKGNP